METTIVLNKEDLNSDFLEGIKKIFKNHKRLQITVSDSEDFDLQKTETKEEYFLRLENAMDDINSNKKLTFTEVEFDKLTKENLK